MNSGINVPRIRSIGAAYIAEARINQMSKWKGIIAIVAIGNPLFYLIAIGIGVGVLVNQNSGTSYRRRGIHNFHRSRTTC